MVDDQREAEMERREADIRFREQKLMANTLNFQDIKGVVGKFSGDDFVSVQKWIRGFEEFAEMARWPDLQKYVFSKRLLEGSAKAVVQSDKEIGSWEQIKMVLTNEFKESFNSAQIHLMMASRFKKENETARQYFVIMKEMGSNGIKDDEINKVMLYGATNSKDFSDKLDVYELISEKVKLTKMNHITNKSPVSQF